MNRRAVIGALGFTQIMAWGSSYYLPAVLAAPIARETGWPLSFVVGGVSLGLLVAALASPLVGKTIERSGGRLVLAGGAAALGVGQIGLACAPNLAAYLVAWLIVGAGMGAGLYDAAFATLGRLYGRDARSAITTLTLFGGFASTLCWPLSAWLVADIGWRGACGVYAGIQLGVALPLYLLVIAPDAAPASSAAEPAPVLKTSAPPLGLLASTLTLSAALSSLMSVHLLTILQAGGVGLASAVGLGALVGPSQVAARAVEIGIARYHHPVWTKIASVCFVAVGLTALWAGLPWLPAALGFYGAGIGLESIARGTLPLALFGAPGYAALMGRLGRPSLLAQAGAPWIGALLLERFGAQATLGVVAALALLNVGLAGMLARGISRQKA